MVNADEPNIQNIFKDRIFKPCHEIRKKKESQSYLKGR